MSAAVASSGDTVVAPTALTTTNTEAIMSAGISDTSNAAQDIAHVEAALSVTEQQTNGSQSTVSAQLQEAAIAETEDTGE